MSSFLGRSDLSRGLRNNNVGNIRAVKSNKWQGKIPIEKNTDAGKSFEQFVSVAYGIRAMLILIGNYINGGFNTIEKVINKYAPPVENNTKKYIDYVAKKTGVSKDTVISELDYGMQLNLCRAIIEYENGKDASLILDSDIDEAIDMYVGSAGATQLKNVNVTGGKKFKFNYIIIPCLLFFYTVVTVFI